MMQIWLKLLIDYSPIR